MTRSTFRKRDRLKLPDDIRSVRKTGERELFPPLVVYRKKNCSETPRVAVALSRKTGPAVLRNWTKRKIRELFRQNKESLGGFDYFFFSSQDLGPLKAGRFADISKRLLRWKSR